MKALSGIAAVLIVLATVAAANAKGCIKGAAVGAVAGHYSGYWEQRLAALSDVTKPTNVTACKETSPINLIVICGMERNAFSASAR